MWYVVIMAVVIAYVLGQDCRTPDSVPGFCVNLEYCSYITMQTQFMKTSKLAVGMTFQRTICGYDGLRLMVCCPDIGEFLYSQPRGHMPPPPPRRNHNRPQTQTLNPLQYLYFNALVPDQSSAPPTNPPQTNPTRPILPTISGPTPYHILTFAKDSCGISNVTSTRVVGGSDSRLGAFPWMALLGYQTDNAIHFNCAGALITSRHVITSAHCLRDTLRLVRLGEHNMEDPNDGSFPMEVAIEKQIRHADFVSRTMSNDIALLKMGNDIKFTSAIRPICLPISEELRTKDLTGYTPFIAGWGSTSFRGPTSSVLQQAQVPIVSTAECEKSFSNLFPDQVIDGSIICAGYQNGGVDACQGDSGGPMMLPQISEDRRMIWYALIGIISYGYECARPGFPGVYTRVTTFIPWINAHLND